MNPNDFPNDGFRGGRGMMFPGDFGGGHNGAGGLAWAIFALELLMLLALAVLLVRAFAFRPGPQPGRFMMHRRGPRDPLAHVRMRYARGDISRDEYLQATRDLGGEPDEPATPGT